MICPRLMVAMSLWIVLSATLMSGAAARSAVFESLDVRIQSVHTMYWQSANGDFDVRVIVANQGWEHVSSSVELQWLKSAETGRELTASARVRELSAGTWSVTVSAVKGSAEERIVVVHATHTYSLEKAEFEIRPSGVGEYVIEQTK